MAVPDLGVQWRGSGNATTTGDEAEYLVFQQTVTAGLAVLASAYPLASLDLQGMVWLQGNRMPGNVIVPVMVPGKRSCRPFAGPARSPPARLSFTDSLGLFRVRASLP